MDLTPKNEPSIIIDQHENHNKFIASPEAIEKIKYLSDARFEEELQHFDKDTQTFLRLVRCK